jgi:hypothetical protein
VRRWLADLVDLEYLALVGDGKTAQGRTARYQIASRELGAAQVSGLLTPAELAALLRRRS